MASVITDPFGIAAPDGQTYFKVLGPPRGLIKGYESLLSAIRTYRAAAARARDPELKAFNRNRAESLDRALHKLYTELDAISKQGASRAEAVIRQNIKRTQVRPDTGRRTRLYDQIVCRPIKTRLPSGSVGIGDMAALDVLAYWRTQEFGYAGFVGREIRGFFMPGQAAPSQSEFRVHPLFEPTPGAPKMTIQNAIPERSFMRDGVESVAVWRQAELAKAQADALTALSRASGGGPAASAAGAIEGALRRRSRR